MVHFRKSSIIDCLEILEKKLANRLYLKQFRSLRIPFPCLLLALNNDKAAVHLTFSANSQITLSELGTQMRFCSISQYWHTAPSSHNNLFLGKLQPLHSLATNSGIFWSVSRKKTAKNSDLFLGTKFLSTEKNFPPSFEMDNTGFF